MPMATSTLSRNSLDRAGQETSPRSPPGMSPAKKFNPTNWTPASSTARTNPSTSASDGTAAAKGHQNSTPSKPASPAAAARSNRGSSVNRMEQLTSYAREWSAMRTSASLRPYPPGTEGQLPVKLADVGAEQVPLAGDRLPVDQDVPCPPVRPQHQPGQGVGHVAEVVARPDHQVGPVAGFQPADVVAAQAGRAALGGQAQRVSGHELRRAAGALPAGVERLAELGEQPADLVGGDPVDPEPDRRAGPHQVDDPAQPRPEPGVDRRAVGHDDPGRPQPPHLVVVEVDSVGHPDVASDPAQLLHQVDRAAPEPGQDVAFLLEGLGEVRVQAQAVPAGQRGRLAHQLRSDAERGAGGHRDHDPLAVV